MPRSFNKSKPSEVEEMREMFMGGASFTDIGRFFKVNHSTVMYWCGHIRGRMPKDLGGKRIEVSQSCQWRSQPADKGTPGRMDGEEERLKGERLERNWRYEEERLKEEKLKKERLDRNRRYKERLHYPEKFRI